MRDIDLVGDAATIAGLRAETEAQARLIRQQAASLAHSQKIFDRASVAARIGVWECSLPSESLYWTDQVYDLFEIPRGSALDRKQILTFYSEDSLKKLHDIRSKAIAERGGFNLDAEITTAKGRRRWLRLTATVECEDGVVVRIFGMKQDITDEKLLYDRLRYFAEFDVMTGLANRSSFQATLSDLGERQAGGDPFAALILLDLDGFKQINDTFGHRVGDECLKEAAIRLKGVCHEQDFVARIGGDEFAVLLSAHLAQGAIEWVAAQIVEALRRPMNVCNCSFQVGASLGIARIGADNASELFTKADTALYSAKAAGRNTFRMYSPSMMRGDEASGLQPRRRDRATAAFAR